MPAIFRKTDVSQFSQGVSLGAVVRTQAVKVVIRAVEFLFDIRVETRLGTRRHSRLEIGRQDGRVRRPRDRSGIWECGSWLSFFCGVEPISRHCVLLSSIQGAKKEDFIRLKARRGKEALPLPSSSRRKRNIERKKRKQLGKTQRES